jgi:hypothetical protein
VKALKELGGQVPWRKLQAVMKKVNLRPAIGWRLLIGHRWIRHLCGRTDCRIHLHSELALGLLVYIVVAFSSVLLSLLELKRWREYLDDPIGQRVVLYRYGTYMLPHYTATPSSIAFTATWACSVFAIGTIAGAIPGVLHLDVFGTLVNFANLQHVTLDSGTGILFIVYRVNGKHLQAQPIQDLGPQAPRR